MLGGDANRLRGVGDDLIGLVLVPELGLKILEGKRPHRDAPLVPEGCTECLQVPAWHLVNAHT